MKIAIYGAGGLGREIALMIQQINQTRIIPWTISGFYDDGKEKGTVVDDLEVLGGIDELNAVKESTAVGLAIANPVIRRQIRQRIGSEYISFPTLIHPSANTGDLKRNRFEEGVIITASNVLTTSIIIEPFTIVNLQCTIGHDVTIGSFSTIMPGSLISGSVRIGSEVLVGSGARLLPGITIGERVKIGAGAVLLEDVPPGVTVVGIPAKVVRKGVEG